MSEIDLLRPARVSVGTVTYEPGGALGPRNQRDLQLVLVHTGSARVWVDGRLRRLAAGQVGLLLPGHHERFAFDPDVPTHHSWIQAHVPDAPDGLIERLERLPVALALSPALEALVREAIASVDSALPAVRAHLAAAALWRYVGEAERGRPERRRPVDDARRFIDAQLEDPELTLGQIAAAAHVTPAHLVRRFRAEHDTTPVAYLWQRRVALGIDLLTNTGLPIALIAGRCGFTSTHHFSRRVRLASGLPPGALRRARWEGGPSRPARRRGGPGA